METFDEFFASLDLHKVRNIKESLPCEQYSKRIFNSRKFIFTFEIKFYNEPKK